MHAPAAAGPRMVEYKGMALVPRPIKYLRGTYIDELDNRA
jgi:hypothetical protein